MANFDERSTRVYRQKQMFSKEELEARENVCIENQPAFCTAACPLKLDARAFVGAIKRGGFTAAREMFERVAPFPVILSRGCDAPCKAVCRIGEVGEGEGVDICALERAAVNWGAAKTGRGMLKVRKKKSAAVFGGDLFSLWLVGELAVKGYPVHFFIPEPDVLTLMQKCAPFLSDEDLERESARLGGMNVTVHWNADVSPGFFEGERGNFDLVGLSREQFLTLGANAPDPQTLYCEQLAAVAPTQAEGLGVTSAIYGAKRAALSIDRLAQGLDPTSSRGEEGAGQSRLYTNMQGVLPTGRVIEHGLYSPEQAQAEAGRCIECRCDECAKGCAYLRHYKKSPRTITREVYNNVSIIMGDHIMNKPINSCALCGQCAVICPNGFDLGEVCALARENMVATGKMPLAPHEFALYDMLFSNDEAFLAKGQPGHDACRYVFFPGCQAGAIAPLAVQKAYADLSARLHGGVGLMLGCCGAIANWAGREELFEQAQALIAGELERLGSPVVIAACPTCNQIFAGMGIESVSVWEILRDLGIDSGAVQPSSAVLHDACGARADPETRQAVRDIAKALGVQIEQGEFCEEKTPCCGYGGLVAYANRELAGEMTQSCMQSGDKRYLTYCMACRDRFARRGQSVHLLELVYDAPAGTPPDISQKRKNRLTLKRDLLKTFWNEDVMQELCDFELEFSPEASALMADRMILDTDVVAVLNAYRETGEAVLDDTGELTARARLANVTFWVKFCEREGGYLVSGAYSHRMSVN